MRQSVLARDLMKGPVRQLTTRTRVRDAAAFLLRQGISGAPVVDVHGRWVGVFTQNDLARYVQDRIKTAPPERTLESREEAVVPLEALSDLFGETPVSHLMSPGLYTVFPEATLEEVVHALTTFKVHRVFVIRERGEALLGVITTMDVLRWMDRNGSNKKRRKKSLK